MRRKKKHKNFGVLFFQIDTARWSSSNSSSREQRVSFLNEERYLRSVRMHLYTSVCSTTTKRYDSSCFFLFSLNKKRNRQRGQKSAVDGGCRRCLHFSCCALLQCWSPLLCKIIIVSYPSIDTGESQQQTATALKKRESFLCCFAIEPCTVQYILKKEG